MSMATFELDDGTKGALDVLRIADGPKDVARAARLAGGVAEVRPVGVEATQAAG